MDIFFLIHHYLIFVSLFNTALCVSSCLYSLNWNLFCNIDGHSLHFKEEYHLVQYPFWGVVQLEKERHALAWLKNIADPALLASVFLWGWHNSFFFSHYPHYLPAERKWTDIHCALVARHAGPSLKLICCCILAFASFCWMHLDSIKSFSVSHSAISVNKLVGAQ